MAESSNGNGAPLPTLELRNRFLLLLKSYAWLMTEQPRWIWGGPQPEPVVRCRELGHIIDAVEGLKAHCEEIQNQADILQTLSLEDAKRNAA